MTKFIVSVDMILEAENADTAHAKGKLIAEELHQEKKVDYFLLADQARPVITPGDD